MKKNGLFLFLFLFIFGQFVLANEKDALLDKIISVYGTQERLDKIKGVIQEGSAYVRLENAKGSFKRVYEYPSKLSINRVFQNIQAKSNITNGKEVWLNNEEVVGSFEELMLLKAKTLFLAKYIAQNRNDIEYKGKITSENDTEWHIFFIKFPSGSEMMLQVDPNTFYIASTITYVHQFVDKKTLLTVYEDYEKIDGVLMAKKEHEYMNKYYIGTINIEKVQFAEKVDSASFAPVAVKAQKK